MRHGSLFSGIGGFDLASEWMGWENIFHCEWNEFGQRVLKHYWPQAISYHDITKTDFSVHRGQIDILTGGFPCQPYSLAGKRKGTADSRHLWPEMLRAILEIQPTWVVGENVSGLVNWSGGLVFDEVQADLEAEGYEVIPFILPACAVNAPHRRDRVWFIAYRKGIGLQFAGDSRERCNGKHEVNTSEGREYALNDIEQVNSENTNGCGCLHRESEKGKSKVGGFGDTGNEDTFNGFSETCKYGFDTCQWVGQSEMCAICDDGDNYQTSDDADWTTSDTNSASAEYAIQTGWNLLTSSLQQDATNTHKSGCEKCETSNFTDRKRFCSGLGIINPTDWQNFPTQSPICGGNDGFSNRLDGITFSKWRNESIKAAGNAIVPQVALQIFKAINDYDNYTS